MRLKCLVQRRFMRPSRDVSSRDGMPRGVRGVALRRPSAGPAGAAFLAAVLAIISLGKPAASQQTRDDFAMPKKHGLQPAKVFFARFRSSYISPRQGRKTSEEERLRQSKRRLRSSVALLFASEADHEAFSRPRQRRQHQRSAARTFSRLGGDVVDASHRVVEGNASVTGLARLAGDALLGPTLNATPPSAAWSFRHWTCLDRLSIRRRRIASRNSPPARSGRVAVWTTKLVSLRYEFPDVLAFDWRAFTP